VKISKIFVRIERNSAVELGELSRVVPLVLQDILALTKVTFGSPEILHCVSDAVYVLSTVKFSPLTRFKYRIRMLAWALFAMFMRPMTSLLSVGCLLKSLNHPPRMENYPYRYYHRRYAPNTITNMT